MSWTLDVDLHRADAAARLFAKVDELAAGLGLMGDVPEDLSGDLEPSARGDLGTDGYVVIPAVCPKATCDALSAMIDRLLDAGLPAVLVLATDAALQLGRRVERVVSAVLERPYVLLEDTWAWKIVPGTAGWAPHRGTTSFLDRAAPELLNTWVALSDVESDRSCMHFVPLDEDPAYPHALDRTDIADGSRMAPVAAGSLLFWNANVLHWGGRCSPTARGSRTSCSYSLGRADVPDLSAAPLRSGLPPLDRIDFVASQIGIYGEGQPDVSPEVLAWARATVALRRLAGGLP